MRVAIIGQQAFGKAVLEAFRARGDAIAAVFAPPAAPGGRSDALADAAAAAGLPLFTPASYGAAASVAALAGAEADLAVMAYVTQFVPQSFCTVPRLGTIQFHPSLLPLHRGPSALSWAIITGRTVTGLSIFRPVDGLDEGPVLLQKEVPILPDDTLGTVYFDKIFPAGVAALVEAADALAAGRARETAQDESQASYEGWVREAESRIDWAQHVDRVYDLVRGCNPAPGAWTLWQGKKLHIFDARKRSARGFGEVRGMQPGQIARADEGGFSVHAQGGFIDVLRCRVGDGAKIAAGAAGVAAGTVLG